MGGPKNKNQKQHDTPQATHINKKKQQSPRQTNNNINREQPLPTPNEDATHSRRSRQVLTQRKWPAAKCHPCPQWRPSTTGEPRLHPPKSPLPTHHAPLMLMHYYKTLCN